MIRSTHLSTLALAALLAAAPAFAQTSATQAQSSNTTNAQIAKEQASLPSTSGSASTSGTMSAPASGVRNPGDTLNSLDPTGTFPNQPSNTPGITLDANTDVNGNLVTPTQTLPGPSVNTLPPAGTSSAPR